MILIVAGNGQNAIPEMIAMLKQQLVVSVSAETLRCDPFNTDFHWRSAAAKVFFRYLY